MSNFHPLEVVDRGSETQLHVGAKLKKLTTYISVLLVDQSTVIGNEMLLNIKIGRYLCSN